MVNVACSRVELDRIHDKLMVIMSTSRLDTSGVFHPLKLQSSQTRLSLPANAIRIRKNGVEFQTGQPIPVWTELTVDLHSPLDGKRIHATGVVVACNGNRHTGYGVSMVFMDLSRQSQERLSRLAGARLA